MKKRRLFQKGFTLIEILAAVSVMSILMIICAQLIGMVSKTLASGKARVDNFSQARMVLGLIDRDIQSMVLRPDVAAFLDKDGATACAFYTRMIGAVGGRKLSLVQYHLDATSTIKPRLLRRDYGMDYEMNAVTPASNKKIVFNTTTKLAELDRGEDQEIAEGVLRFECQFLAIDGTLPATFSFDYSNPPAAANTGAVVVSILVIDSKAYTLAQQPDGSRMTALLTAFAGTPASGQIYSSYWRDKMKVPGFGAGLPRPLLQSVRIFDRTIRIPLQTTAP